MEPNLTLVLVSGFLIACGVYLLLERSLTRILIGIMLASNGVNLLYPVVAGQARQPAFVGMYPESDITDPLPQAMVLTSIVITLATTAFLLAMAYRAVQVNGHDEVQDDVEDAVIRRLAAFDEASESFEASADAGEPGEEAGADLFDDWEREPDEGEDDAEEDDRPGWYDVPPLADGRAAVEAPQQGGSSEGFVGPGGGDATPGTPADDHQAGATTPTQVGKAAGTGEVTS